MQSIRKAEHRVDYLPISALPKVLCTQENGVRSSDASAVEGTFIYFFYLQVLLKRSGIQLTKYTTENV